MANSKSAQKRIRRNTRRQTINKTRVSRIRTFIKKVEAAISSGDKQAAQESYKVLQPEFQRGASKGVFHKNTMARKMSRLAQGIKSIGGANLEAVADKPKKAPAKKTAPKKPAAKKAPAKKAPAKKTATKKPAAKKAPAKKKTTDKK